MEPTSTDLENALRKSFAVIQQLKLELAQAQQTAHEPIAIVSMACRFPGGANSPEAFWQSLREGRDCRTEIPADRWDWRQFYNPDPAAPGTHYMRHGYFVDRVGDFDPEFFGIAGREAASLDPQHRLLLETSWEALERAGLSADRLRSSRTAVYVGIGQNDYAQLQMYGPAPERITPYDGTGISFCFAAARLSYTLGLNGPNLAVDTACSSSLVALHLACNSLAARECDQALVGGSHLIVSPQVTVYLSRLKALSPDGRSKAFSADADGYGRGEGCGMLLLKRLSDARRDGDQVLAVVRGSAVNHGGAGSGLTVPNGLAQQALLRDALSRARLTPAEIGWIEAHGTGTALGDPIEVNALGDIFRAEGRGGRPVYLSSVKTNIGHLEAAAGIAGVIKAVLALQHGEIPPHLHLGTANPQIDWQGLPFSIPTAPIPWDGPRAVGVSAFGLGGTNAHVILSAPDTAAPADNSPAAALRPLLLSARTPEALAAQRDAFADLLAREDAPAYADIAQTAALGRRHFEYRLGIAASDASSAAAKLRQAVLPKQAASSRRGSAPPRIAYLFTGQGSQYCGMGQTLWRQEPAFRAAVEQCAGLIEQATGWSPLPFIRDTGDDPRIDQTAYTQPALFTLQVGLVSLWRSWGMAPDVVIGHSIGEFAAAWCAGILGLEDAVRLVVERGRLMQRLPAGGGMAALRVDEATAHGIIAAHPELALAAINGPQAVTIAGPLPVLEQCLRRLEQEGTLFQRLPVSHAFHSGLMEPMLPDFAQTLSSVRFAPPKVAFIPTGAEGTPVDSAAYWREQIRNPVRFSAAAARLAAAGAQVLVEIGPAAPLLALARQSVSLPGALWLPSLERHNPEALAGSLSKLYAEGIDLRWQDVFAGPRRPVLLPTYPFQRRRCWVETAPANTASAARTDPDQHPLLGAAIPSPLATRQYDAQVSSRQPAFLGEHRVLGQALYPAAAFVEMALTAAAHQFGQARLRLLDVEFLRPLPLPDGQARRLQLVLTPEGANCTIAIHSSEPHGGGNAAWQLHMRCRAQPLAIDGGEGPLEEGPRLSSLPGSAFYEASRQRGIDYGPTFQTLQSLDSHAGETGSAAYALAAEQADPRYLLPPVLLDTGLQALAAARPGLGQRTYVPAAIAQLDFTPGAALQGRVHTRIDQDGADGTLCSLQLRDAAGQPCVKAHGIRMQPIAHAGAAPAPVWLPRWQPAPSVKSAPTGHWLLLGDDLPTAEALGARLRAAGCTVEIGSAATAWTPGHGFSAVCCLALHDEDPSSPAHRELALVRQLGALPESEQPALLFATQGAQAVEAGEQPRVGRGALWGLARVARNEYPTLHCRCVDLDPVADLQETATALLAECAMQAPDAEDQVAWRQRSRVALRLQAAERQPPDTTRQEPGRLRCQRVGDLDSLGFTPWKLPPPGPGEMRVRVRAASLNFKDLLHALGALPMPEHQTFGFDAAGTVEALGPGADGRLGIGDRVMLSLTPGALGDVVNARGDFVCRMPQGLDFAGGAALPLAYLTAWHALVVVAQLKAGEHVLIHAAAGGVGQAAVAIARLLDAQVHATASPAKHGHLRRAGLRHIYNSRDTAFGGQVRAATGGAGVDVVLNCLNGDSIAASFDCLRHGGRFVEIGKAGIWHSDAAQAYRADVAYAPFDLADVAAAEPAHIRGMFALLAQHLAEGRLPPLPVRSFTSSEVSAAFRLMSRSRHIGKVVVEFPPTAGFDGVQVVSGGFGSLGRLLGQDLAARGAKHLALLVRTAPHDEQQAFLDTLAQGGMRVRAYPVDLTDAAATQAVLERIAQDFGIPVRAIYHTAGVLSDHPLERESPANFATVAAPKLRGAWNLHLATRGLDLQRFVLFSSAAALIGTPGQGSYATANAGLDALAAARRGAGLPALSVNWGPWGAAGMAARLAEAGRQRMAATGIAPLRTEAAFEALFQLDTQPDSAQAMVMDVDWRTFLARFPGAQSASLYRGLSELQPDAPASHTAAGENAPGTLIEHITGQPADRRRGELFRQLQRRVATILGRPNPDDIAPTQGFFALGMDSLTSMELRTSLQRDLGIPLPATLTFDYGSIEALTDHLLGQVPAWQTADAPPPTPADDALADLSEDELAAMLARELEN